ncbi:MAG: CYTH domain-containing protein [Gammaproteobacteria bacterium]
MATEIERKFLLLDDRWRSAVIRSEHLVQGYLAADTRTSVRVRVSGDAAWLNIKGATLGVARAEFEYAIPLSDAREMLALFCAGRMLAKTRCYVPFGAHVWEIDVFEGRNAGLVVAELELTRAEETFMRPAWLGAEVSSEARYYNSCLIDAPYDTWPEASQAGTAVYNPITK